MAWVPGRRPESEEEALRRREEMVRKELARCWRCGLGGLVPEGDELGLCNSCKEMLRDPDYVKPFFAPPIPDGPSRTDESGTHYPQPERGL